MTIPMFICFFVNTKPVVGAEFDPAISWVRSKVSIYETMPKLWHGYIKSFLKRQIVELIDQCRDLWWCGWTWNTVHYLRHQIAQVDSFLSSDPAERYSKKLSKMFYHFTSFPPLFKEVNSNTRRLRIAITVERAFGKLRSNSLNFQFTNEDDFCTFVQ